MLEYLMKAIFQTISTGTISSVASTTAASDADTTGSALSDEIIQ